MIPMKRPRITTCLSVFPNCTYWKCKSFKNIYFSFLNFFPKITQTKGNCAFVRDYFISGGYIHITYKVELCHRAITQ